MTLLTESPPAVAVPKRMSMDEFMALPDSERYELLEGILTERKPMGVLSSYVASHIQGELYLFCRERNGGEVFGADATYACFGHEATVRRPDVSFVARGRMPADQIPEDYFQIAADLAVEVVSPNDLAYDVEDKVGLYLRHGFGEVWVVYPNRRSVFVRRAGERPIELPDDQVLTGRGPLEGFSCPVSRFFPPAASPAPTAP
jgi:Uma2 family endonuclease